MAKKRWLELRIHGVHGATPESMLGVPTVRQYAGDKLTGFYRAAEGQRLPGRNDLDEVVVEAYSWGGLTSGVQGAFGQVKRALWLLLLPFALANLAYWARIHVGEDTRQARFGQRVVRLSALVLTVFFTLSVCFVGIDLVGWQCFRAGVPACAPLPDVVEVMGRWRPGQRIAVGAVLPILALVLLAKLSRTSTRRYEDVPEPVAAGALPGPAFVLKSASLWDGGDRTRSMGRVHVSAGMAVVVATTAAHAGRNAFLTGFDAYGWSFLVIGVLAGCGLLTTAAFVCVRLPGDESLPAGKQGWVGGPRAASLLLWSTVALVLVDLGFLLVENTGAYDQYSDYTWHDEELVLVFVALTVLHLCLFTSDRMTSDRWNSWWFLLWPAVTSAILVTAAVVTVTHKGPDLYSTEVLTVVVLVACLGAGLALWHFFVASEENRHRAWNGAGASVFLAAAAWVALLFTTATVTASADYLNGEASPAELSTSADPFPGQAAGNEPQQNITIEGPVVLTRYDGPNGPLEVSARDAWITPEPAPDSGKPKPACPSWLPEVLRCKDPPRPAYFHLAPGTRTATTATYQTGTQVVTRSVTKSGGDVAATSHVTRADETVPAGSFDLVLNDRHPTPLVLPPVLVWSPIAQLVWMLAAALTLMFCWVRFRISVAPAIRESRPVPENGPDLFRSTNFTPSGPRFWHVTGWEAVTETRRVRIGGALAHRGEQLLNYTGAITAPIALFLVGLSSTNDLVNAGSTVLYTAANVSMYFVVGLSVVLLALGSKVRTSEGMAKTAGIVWDLTTFWPRSAHPLSPPCYTERVVPELQRRINWARAQDPPYGVVISAHSQGSLISVAALIRRADLSGIRFVSYGSQIRGLYGRAFPGVFGPEVVGYEPTKGPIKLGDPFPDLPRADVAGLTGPDEGSLKRRFGKRWVNLFRRGDPLGYRVFSDVVDDANDRVILEPRLRVAGDPGSVEYLGHSYYMHTPEYRALVAGWTDTTFVLPGSDVAALEPLPER